MNQNLLNLLRLAVFISLIYLYAKAYSYIKKESLINQKERKYIAWLSVIITMATMFFPRSDNDLLYYGRPFPFIVQRNVSEDAWVNLLHSDFLLEGVLSVLLYYYILFIIAGGCRFIYNKYSNR